MTRSSPSPRGRTSSRRHSTTSDVGSAPSRTRATSRSSASGTAPIRDLDDHRRRGACSGACLSTHLWHVLQGIDGITLRELQADRAELDCHGSHSTATASSSRATRTSSSTNVTVTDSQRSNIDLNGVNARDVHERHRDDAAYGNGIGISDSNDITINGSRRPATPGAASPSTRTAAFYPCGVNGVTITNASLGEASAIYTGIDYATSTHGGTARSRTSRFRRALCRTRCC